MATISKYYKKEVTDAIKAEFTSGDLYVALFKNTLDYANIAGVQHYAEILADECAGAGYTAGGIALTNVMSANVGNIARLTADSAIFAAVTVTPMYAVIYNTNTDCIRAVYNLNADIPVTAGTLTLTWSASGVISVN
jgi:hypothetical protein